MCPNLDHGEAIRANVEIARGYSILFRIAGMLLQLHGHNSQSIMLQHTEHRPRSIGREVDICADKHRPTSAPRRHKKGSFAAEHEGFCAIFLAFGSAEHAPSEHYAKFATGMTEVAEDVSWSSNLDTTSVWTMWAAITRQLTTRGVLGNFCLEITS